MPDKKWKMMVVPETHWDREWYLTFQQFRHRLVRLVDKLLNILETDKRYRYYCLDGQTVVLEDYLEIRPENRERIAAMVTARRLFVGPWYVLPDEFLVSGEAVVHNILLGHKIAAEFGGVMKAGYVPDPFGHISQLPQILAGFDLPSMLFMRGVGNELDNAHNEFWWEAPDGTRVLGIHLINTYCNGANLGYRGQSTQAEEGAEVDMDKALEQLTEQRDSLSQRAATPYLLLNNGCDHLEPQPELPEIIEYANRRLDDMEVIHSNYEAYTEAALAEVGELHMVQGELHGGKYWQVFPGVFSARMYLKQANERCQTLLEKWAEPLSAFAWLEGAPYEQSFLWAGWRQLLRNHPHDSICGCSTDQVHQQMMSRFEQAEQIAETLVEESAQHLSGLVQVAEPSVPEDCICARKVVVFNSHNFRRQEAVAVKLRAPVDPGIKPLEVVVQDADGEIVSSQVISQHVREYEAGIPEDKLLWEAEVLIQADVPTLGLAGYTLVTESAKQRESSSEIVAGANWIENECVRVEAEGNGTLHIIDKVSAVRYEGVHLFEDSEDAGDEYDYSPAANSMTITSKGNQACISVIERGPVRATMRIDLTLDLPQSLADNRQRRAEQSVPCEVTTLVSITSSSPRISFETSVDNRARDHRLRVWFPTGCTVTECHAESHFDVVTRSLDLPEAEDWFQPPQPTKPTQGFVDVSDNETGLAVCSVGLPEYEVFKTDEGAVIALTLLRAVGWLSRSDLLTRSGNAGPKTPTPVAQCLGKHTFHYALVPHQSDWFEAEIWKYSASAKAPLRAFVSELSASGQHRKLSFLRVEPDNLVVTAVKKAERYEALIVRFYNISGEATSAYLTCYKPIAQAELVNLNEELVESLDVDDSGSVTLPKVPGRRIITVALRFAD